jgi:predicted Zn-dependent protease
MKSPGAATKLKSRRPAETGTAKPHNEAPRAAGSNRGELHRIAARVLALSPARETEVEITAVTDALTRFANNAIHQNVTEEGLHVSVRVVVDGRTARAATNRTDDEALRQTIATAMQLAKFQPRNPNLLPMPGPVKSLPLTPRRYFPRYFPKTAAMSPQDRASVVRGIVRLAARRGQTAAGIYSNGYTQTVFINSRGLAAEHAETECEFSVTVMEENSSGWAKGSSPDAAMLNPLEMATRASDKARASRDQHEIAPGHYTVILEPAAVLDLAGFLFYDFAGTAVLDQRSCLTKRMGKPLFGENITLWDDVYHPLQTGAPFDGEGVPRQRVLLVENGVPRNLVYARATAGKMKARPTGHGFALPNEYGEAPMNLVFAGGDSSLEEMIRSTKRGILVTRLWYIREVDPYEKIMTGMTRDGTFLVENGAVVCGIRNFRFNQSLITMLCKVEALGPAVRASGEESFDMVVPAMKICDFHFTEATRF